MRTLCQDSSTVGCHSAVNGFSRGLIMESATVIKVTLLGRAGPLCSICLTDHFKEATVRLALSPPFIMNFAMKKKTLIREH